MMMTKSPPSTWGAKVGLCLPRRRIAVWLARRPRTTSVASMTCQVRVTSAGFGVKVRKVLCLYNGSDGAYAVGARGAGWSPARAHDTTVLKFRGARQQAQIAGTGAENRP